MKKEKDNSMIGKYKEFYFTVNEDESIILKQETPVFYNKNLEYTCGIFHRVVFPSPQKLEENKLYKQSLASLFYLNPLMSEEQFNKIYNYWKKIEGFDFSYTTYRTFYDNRLEIDRNECYFQQFNTIPNTLYFSTKYNLVLGGRELTNKINLWYKQNAKKLHAEWMSWQCKNYFFEHIDSYDLSPEKLMNVFDVKDKRTIVDYLKEYGIVFTKDYIEYKADGVTKRIPLSNTMDDLIKKTISYHIRINKCKITTSLLIKECSFITNDNKTVSLNRKRLWEFFRDNKEYKEKVEEYNKSYTTVPEVMIDPRVKQKYQFLKTNEYIDGDSDDEWSNIKLSYTPTKDNVNYYVNEWGKRVYKNEYRDCDFDNEYNHIDYEGE